MKTARYNAAVAGAVMALAASLALMFYGPRDSLGWVPVGILAETVFWPGVMAGSIVGEWTGSVQTGWAAGIAAMTLLGAALGTLIGGVIELFSEQRR